MVFITLIQALCQQSFGLTLPQNCVRPTGPQKEKSGSCSGGGFLVQIGLLVRVEPGKEVKSLTNPDRAQEPEGIP
jgi:hypothetical protein